MPLQTQQHRGGGGRDWTPPPRWTHPPTIPLKKLPCPAASGWPEASGALSCAVCVHLCSVHACVRAAGKGSHAAVLQPREPAGADLPSPKQQKYCAVRRRSHTHAHTHMRARAHTHIRTHARTHAGARARARAHTHTHTCMGMCAGCRMRLWGLLRFAYAGMHRHSCSTASDPDTEVAPTPRDPQPHRAPLA